MWDSIVKVDKIMSIYYFIKALGRKDYLPNSNFRNDLP